MAGIDENPLPAMSRSEVVMDYIMKNAHDENAWYIFPFLKVPLDDLFLTKHALMLLIGAGFMFLLFIGLYRRNDRVPHGLTNALEVFILFIRDQICIPNIGEKDGRKLTPLFCSFFFFILILNLMGLIPLFAGATANIGVTAGLALVTLSFMIFGTIYLNGLSGFTSALIPHGVPWPVLILLVPIEFAGLFIKAIALTIRLFANMLAGGIVIYALLGMVVIYGIAASPILGMALVIYLLKVFVAFLQAYIFTLLSAIFIGQMVHPAH